MADYYVTAIIVMMAVFGGVTVQESMAVVNGTMNGTTTIANMTTAAITTIAATEPITTAASSTKDISTIKTEQTETEETNNHSTSAFTTSQGKMNQSVGVVRPTSPTTLSQAETSGSSSASTLAATTTRGSPDTTPSAGTPLAVAIIAAAAVIIVFIVLITAICLCYMASRNHKSSPSDGVNFKPNDVRVVAPNGHSAQTKPSATVNSINEHSARISETATLPSTNPLNKANSGIYSRDINTAERGSTSPNNDIYPRDIHTSDGTSKSPTGSQRSTSRTNSLNRASNGEPSGSRAGSKNIFDKIDPTTEEVDELELSPTVSPSNGSVGKDSIHGLDRDSGQPQALVRRNIPNAQDNLLKRPTPQPRPRLNLNKNEGAEDSGNAISSEPSPGSPGSPESRKDNRPFKKGKGPDGSDQAALLANVIRKTPRPLSHISTEGDGETNYW